MPDLLLNTTHIVLLDSHSNFYYVHLHRNNWGLRELISVEDGIDLWDRALLYVHSASIYLYLPEMPHLLTHLSYLQGVDDSVGVMVWVGSEKSPRCSIQEKSRYCLSRRQWRLITESMSIRKQMHTGTYTLVTWTACRISNEGGGCLLKQWSFNYFLPLSLWTSDWDEEKVWLILRVEQVPWNAVFSHGGWV